MFTKSSTIIEKTWADSGKKKYVNNWNEQRYIIFNQSMIQTVEVLNIN